MRKITVIGAGYVGLVTGACLAQKGFFVTVVENNLSKISALLNGKIPFYEPGLDTVVSENIQNKKIEFVASIQEALVSGPEVIFSCVGTPPLEDGSADLSYVWQVAVEVGKHINNYCLIINKSTVPVGTGANVKKIIATQLKERGVLIEFDVASNPEFLKEGDALNDFLSPDRIVVGVESKRAETILREIYAPFIASDAQFLSMNLESAELTKYASNSMLATRISFMNELAHLADRVGADINQVKNGMAKDRRIGQFFLNAGIGYGGSCFPKDIKALIATGLEYAQPMTLVQTVEDVNNEQRYLFTQKILNHYGDNISSKRIGIWGLAFKPETDDLRCAPAIDIVKILVEKGATLTVYDPVAQENFKALFGNSINYATTPQDVIDKSDCLVILTEWKEFIKYKPADFGALKDKIVFDGRNCFSPEDMFFAGIKYVCVGRNSISQKLENSIGLVKKKSESHLTQV